MSKQQGGDSLSLLEEEAMKRCLLSQMVAQKEAGEESKVWPALTEIICDVTEVVMFNVRE